jgi:hypothetical protein
MKRITLYPVLVLMLCSTTAFAKIWRVNNNNGVAADFTTLQAAHNGAASGDTLHVEGSATNYGSLTSTKTLVIIGPGYYLAANPNTQASQLSAQVSSITLNAGAEGSMIMGLDFRGGQVYIYTDDITIKRNRFNTENGAQNPDWSTGYIYLYQPGSNYSRGVSNIVISQNFGVQIQNSYASTGLLITNNYIGSGSSSGAENTVPALNLHAGTVALIQNNILRRGKVTAHNSTLSNNIMVTGTLEGTGNMMSNNMGNSTQFGTENGNKSNIDMATVFVGAGEGISADGQWKLKVGSPAIGAGYGGVDAGMYGNHTPYVLSGIPPVPAIYFFESQPVGSNTDPIDVTIKVKSNQ